MSACRARSASAVKAATSAGVPRLARISASSRATSAGWIPAWAYLVRDWRSRAAALSHSRCRSVALFQADALERELLAGRVAQQQPFEDRLDHVVAAVGDGDGDAEGLADLLVLAEQHVQDDAVDAVVRAVQRDGADDVGALAEPVDAAFALLVAGRVPGQVVVDDGLEVVLQVHALGQAVGRDQHRPPRRRRRSGP